LNEAYQNLQAVELSLIAPKISFSQRRGQLHWPVNGEILHPYGSTRVINERWKGVYITTQPDTLVRTPHAGTVVFSGWLKGYGLLMIIEHPDNYMTLYGNNTALLQEKGTLVKAGEIIASTGFGPHGYGLYFEIRKNGVPQNPKNWLVKR